MWKAAVAAIAMCLGSSAHAITVFQTDIDDLISGAEVINFTDTNANITSLASFSDHLLGGSSLAFVTVKYETLLSPSVFDAKFGVGTAVSDYSLGSTGPSGDISHPFSFTETFRVNQGDELFITFDVVDIKGGGYSYEVTASAVPLPPSLALLGSGLGLMGLVHYRRRKKATAA